MDRRQAARLTLAAGAAWAGLGARAEDSKPERSRLRPGDEAPPPLGRRRDGTELKLDDLAGQVVVVNFWAAWCPHCRKELPVLEKLQAAGKGAVSVVAVNVEDRDAFRAIARTLAQTNFTLTHDADKAVRRAWRSDGSVPYTLVVDRERRVRWSQYGWSEDGSPRKLLEAVNAALAAPAAPATQAAPPAASGTG